MTWLLMLWEWILARFDRGPRPYRTARVQELPSTVKARTVYLVGEGKHLWTAAMSCPCGCGETIQLNLLAGHIPRWSIMHSNNGPVTIHPSVWRRSGCKSHFCFRDGQVIWCEPRRRGVRTRAA